MDAESDKWAGDAAVRATRTEILDRVAKCLRDLPDAPIVTTFSEEETFRRVTVQTAARLRSALLWVAQYWADNADDEVHLRVSASSREVPAWPHACTSYPVDATHVEVCYHCATVVPTTYDWGYSALIPAFEAFCHEGANQEQDDIASHRPFARVWLDAHGVAETEIVGKLVRPWLDMPRTLHSPVAITPRITRLIETVRDDARAIAVLGDALEEELPGHPLGELVAVGRATDPEPRARYRDLLADGVGRAWLGAFDRHVPRSGVRYTDGVPVEIGLWIDPEARSSIDREATLPWAFGPSVRFLPSSSCAVWPALAPVRALGPLDGVALEQLAETSTVFALDELEVELLLDDDLELLFAVGDQLPNLRTLRIVGVAATADAALSRLRAWSRLPSLARLEIASVRSRDVHVAELLAWRAARLPCPVAVIMYDHDARCASGWSIGWTSDAPDDVIVEHRGYLIEANRARLADLLAALPGARVELRGGPTWSPASYSSPT